jgi:carbon-monoxide dehydrogenase large subunit
MIGASPERLRDGVLLTGSGRFVSDIDLPGQAWARVVRSPLAHAKLAAVGTDAARALPGVVCVLTAADVPDVRIPIRLAFAATTAAGCVLQPLLAREVVRYVGEPVALVVAEDPWIAEDGAELVELDLEPLDILENLLSATAPAAPLVHEELGTNLLDTFRFRSGSVDEAFAAADVVIRRQLEVARQAGAPMETRGLVAEPGSGGALTVWGAAKVKHFNRSAIAQLLGLDQERLRLVEVDVGGGFGVRGEVYPEDILVPLAALRIGRPVKWIEDRAEHLVAANHARGGVYEVEVGARADGSLVGFRATYWVDQGAYARTQGILPALLPAQHLPGPYVWEAFDITAHAVLTHRTPVGTCRGPGMTEAAFVRERVLDLLATEVGLDPVALRRRNLVPRELLPFVYDLGADTPPIVYDSGDFPGSFERLLEAAGYGSLRETQARRREAGEAVGIGVAATLELGAIGPFEDASVEFLSSGDAVVRADVASLGQGIETVLAQIAADALRVPMERIVIRHHDTDDTAFGFGSFASRSTVLAGNAVALACRALLARAAAELNGDVSAIEIADGVAREGGREVDLASLGAVTARFDKPLPSFSFGASLTVVSVDQVTGRVKSERHVVAHDVGRAVNPALVEGQIVGAAAHGIGQALLEELPYDAVGQPLAVSFADYRLPTAAETPPVEVVIVETGAEGNPLGLKGAGEGGIVGAPASVANAVADALGVDVTSIPLTPPRLGALAASARA